MNGSLFNVMSDIEIDNKKDLYLLMVRYINSEYEAELFNSLIKREKEGNIAIANHIILPHLESDLIDESKILIVRLRNRVKWSSEIGEVKLIISIFLKTNESEITKRKISSYMRKLSDEEYLDYLMQADDLDSSNLKLS